MRFVLFYHSLESDWNHGNAHFLRGVATELIQLGHDVRMYEPAESWSRQNLVAEHGQAAIARFHDIYPELTSTRYRLDELDLADALTDADVVIVHEWSDHQLVSRVGQQKALGAKFTLLFHDTHHRAVTDPAAMAAYDLSHYDSVLAYGDVLRRLYLERKWVRRAWTWHEAADTRVFRPIKADREDGDLIWIGNWGDDERAAELNEFLIKPVKELNLKARVHGVRYPDEARAALKNAGVEYAGWIANFEAPRAFSRFKFTVHVPRRPYVNALPGIPTIRVFEALACGIPLICSPWPDAEHLFTPGRDYLIASDGEQMKRHMRELVHNTELRRQLAEHGLATILARHTCAHRVEQLLGIVNELRAEPAPRAQHARKKVNA